MISKELLSEVLKENVLSVRQYIEYDIFYKNVIMYECRKDTYDTINIYELANKCKEWAVAQGYNVTSKVTIRGGRGCKTQSIATARLITDTSVFKIYSANTEPQSIFKSCQWILDSKKEGN